jgi:hypothetical protein
MQDILKLTEITICLNRGIVYMDKSEEGETSPIGKKRYMVEELGAKYSGDRIVSAISRDIKELEDTIKNTLGDFKTTEETIEWVKNTFMDYEPNLLNMDGKTLNPDKTMSIV